ncbi:hypothetical protein [Natronomonas sp. EA1]|uniref:hypothetical protein n=1 Tax=Natronomonas sp. EA1 TaxID=3421655 RepID=UPI003EB81CDB
MPSIDLTESQADRLESVRAELESAIAGKYATVRTVDALEYLLDTYTPPEEADVSPEASADAAATPTSDEPTDIVEDAVEPESGDAEAEPDPEEASNASENDGGPNRLQAMMNLLKTHDDKWAKSGGDAPYEVTLPDGGTKPARTKDDVRRLLFKHYR